RRPHSSGPQRSVESLDFAVRGRLPAAQGGGAGRSADRRAVIASAYLSADGTGRAACSVSSHHRDFRLVQLVQKHLPASSHDRDEIRAHVERHLGRLREVLREGTDPDEIEILHVPPQETRPVRTLVTCGMSDYPMSVPPGSKAPRYIELMVT